MSAEAGQRRSIGRLILLWGLLASAGNLLADETEMPELEFLEYLGSWEESDETWMIFSAVLDEEKEPESQDKDNDEGSDPAPDGEKLAELDDEN